MAKSIDCIVCGTCVADVLVRPYPLHDPPSPGELFYVDPVRVSLGGIVSNAGSGMSRLGLRVAAIAQVGDDEWAPIVRERLAAESIDTSRIVAKAGLRTCVAVALIDPSGERSFAYSEGATEAMDRAMVLDQLDQFAASRMALFGYYSMLPNLEDDLPEVLAEVRKVGCMTAMDAAGVGGTMQPLERILPHLDVYCPSLNEACQQTGKTDPREILTIYRQCGAPGILGVKLGAEGALLSPRAGEFLPVGAAQPPGPVIDTTGAGDAFFAGLITGLLRGMEPADAARLGAATGAYCVTGTGGTTVLASYEQAATLAALSANT